MGSWLFFEYFIRLIRGLSDRSDRGSVAGFGICARSSLGDGLDSSQFNARELNQASPASTMRGAWTRHSTGEVAERLNAILFDERSGVAVSEGA
jgi:hypothetical protein